MADNEQLLPEIYRGTRCATDAPGEQQGYASFIPVVSKPVQAPEGSSDIARKSIAEGKRRDDERQRLARLQAAQQQRQL